MTKTAAHEHGAHGKSRADYYKIAEHIRGRTSHKPVVGIICGSGLSGLSSALQNSQTIAYETIPGFPRPSVQGHTGELVFGTIGGIETVCLRGRFHFYEGHGMDVVTLPVRVMRLLGVKLLIVTNAAGGLNPDYNVGDIALIHDHIGLPIMAGNNPLIGKNDDLLGPRFPAVSNAYNGDIREIVVDIAQELGLANVVRAKSTYCFVAGPAYESIAEANFLRRSGGDTVGMSTIPEVIVAKHCGMAVVGMSLITNKVVTNYTETNHATHEEVLESVKNSGRNVENIVKKFVSKEKIGHILDAMPDVSTEFPKSFADAEGVTTTGTSTCKATSALHTVVALTTLFIVATSVYRAWK